MGIMVFCVMSLAWGPTNLQIWPLAIVNSIEVAFGDLSLAIWVLTSSLSWLLSLINTFLLCYYLYWNIYNFQLMIKVMMGANGECLMLSKPNYFSQISSGILVGIFHPQRWTQAQPCTWQREIIKKITWFGQH